VLERQAESNHQPHFITGSIIPMRNTIVPLLVLILLLKGAARDRKNTTPGNGRDPVTEKADSMSDTVLIKAGGKEFRMTLLDNPTATAFKAMLPLSINMTELNGNEKYFRFSRNLPTNESNPGTIESGDLMLYGSNTLVLFYETFSTSYSYTPLGKITNVTGLAAALGSGNVAVTISLI
jgi:hypothetical protein